MACPVPLPENNGSPCLSHTAVRLELQADDLAGVWAHPARNKSDIPADGEIDKAIPAASCIGGGTLQM